MRDAPRLSPGYFANRVESSSDDLGANAWVHEFMCKFANDGFENVRWCEVVCGLGECDEDGSYAKLMVCEVSVKAVRMEMIRGGLGRT